MHSPNSRNNLVRYLRNSPSMSEKRVAVVTGGNKGIGYAICKDLASRGIIVILTARDETRGLEAMDKLQLECPDFSDNVLFHQLDVCDPDSISALANFVMNWFRRLHILINNAAIVGAVLDADGLRAYSVGKKKVDWTKVSTETFELAKECIETNYYGPKRVVEALHPFMLLMDSPCIVNVSCGGKLACFPKGSWAKEVVISSVETIKKEEEDELYFLEFPEKEKMVDEVVEKFLKDFEEYLNDPKEGSLEAKGWPVGLSAYHVSKVALNSYTRILALEMPGFRVNCVCPGFVKTDANFHTGLITPEEGAKGPVHLALLPDDGPTGQFFEMENESIF